MSSYTVGAISGFRLASNAFSLSLLRKLGLMGMKHVCPVYPWPYGTKTATVLCIGIKNEQKPSKAFLVWYFLNMPVHIF